MSSRETSSSKQFESETRRREVEESQENGEGGGGVPAFTRSGLLSGKSSSRGGLRGAAFLGKGPTSFKGLLDCFRGGTLNHGELVSAEKEGGRPKITPKKKKKMARRSSFSF